MGLRIEPGNKNGSENDSAAPSLFVELPECRTDWWIGAHVRAVASALRRGIPSPGLIQPLNRTPMERVPCRLRSRSRSHGSGFGYSLTFLTLGWVFCLNFSID